MTGNRISAWLYANSSTLADEGIFVDYTQPVHPTFLYESLWCLLGFLLLHFLKQAPQVQRRDLPFVLRLVWVRPLLY